MHSLLLSRLLVPMLLLAPTGGIAVVPGAPSGDAVLRTLEEGEAARAAGDYAALLDAAQMLDLLGATPAQGQDDMAARWTDEARARGIVPVAPRFRGRLCFDCNHPAVVLDASRFAPRTSS